MARNLRCEYRTDPICVDRQRPRLSWELTGTGRGIHQTHYRVVVTDEAGRELWDTGRVESSAQACVYDGKALESFRRYRWTVHWTDGEGTLREPDRWAWFETAVLPGTDWPAEWIVRERPDTFLSNTVGRRPDNRAADKSSPPVLGVYLRREFGVQRSAGKTLTRARAYTSGLGCFELEINGRRVGDAVLEPGQTDYEKLALYTVEDVTDLLVEGQNVVGIVVGNGRHLGAYGYGIPRVTSFLRIEYSDGGVEIVKTDSSWKTSHGPIRENGFFFGETIDRRADNTGWSAAGYQDASWDSAKVIEDFSPVLSAQIMPPARRTHELTPERIYEIAPGKYICDFGQNFSGWVRLGAEGPAGTTVTVRFSELTNEDGTLNLQPNRFAECTDRFILKGDGVECFEPHFTYHGFRYAEISGYPGVPTPDDVTGVFVHTDLPNTGSFHCEDDLVNRIHRIIWWGQLSNYLSMPTDCPQRDERMGWMGDAQLTVEEAMYNFDMALAYEKYLEDIRVCQREDGSISDVVPPYWPFYPADPAWGAAYVIITWYLYRFYGDAGVIERYFDSIKRYVEYLRSISEDDTLNFGKYGDWCPPASTFPKKTPVALTSSFFYYHDVLHLARMAEVIGRDEDHKKYQELSGRILAAFNRRFLGEGGLYEVVRTSPMDKSCGQTSQVLPLYLDMVPEKHRAAAYRQLHRSVARTFDYHVDTGIVGSRYLFDVLARHGDAETAYRAATQTSYPGFGYMIREGATTMWERWEKLQGEGMNSQNHIMLGSIDGWFYRVLAGLAPGEPGWSRVLVRPHPPEDLGYCSATVDTIRGRAAVSWRKTDDGLILTVSLPPGTSGEIAVPCREESFTILETGVEEAVVWTNEQPRDPVPSGGQGSREGETVVFEVPSGYYRFEVRG